MSAQKFMCRTIGEDYWWETDGLDAKDAAKRHAIECWETSEIEAADSDSDEVPIGERREIVVAVEGHGVRYRVSWNGKNARAVGT